MKELIVDVKLWGRMVGSLVWNTQTGAVVFEYDSNFRRSDLEISPLTMPLSLGTRPFTFLENRNECFKELSGRTKDGQDKNLLYKMHKNDEIWLDEDRMWHRKEF